MVCIRHWSQAVYIIVMVMVWTNAINVSTKHKLPNSFAVWIGFNGNGAIKELFRLLLMHHALCIWRINQWWKVISIKILAFRMVCVMSMSMYMMHSLASVPSICCFFFLLNNGETNGQIIYSLTSYRYYTILCVFQRKIHHQHPFVQLMTICLSFGFRNI